MTPVVIYSFALQWNRAIRQTNLTWSFSAMATFAVAQEDKGSKVRIIGSQIHFYVPLNGILFYYILFIIY